MFYKRKLSFFLSDYLFFIGLLFILFTSLFRAITSWNAIYYDFRLVLYFIAIVFLTSFFNSDLNLIPFVFRLLVLFSFIHAVFVYIQAFLPGLYSALEFQGAYHIENAAALSRFGAYVGLNNQTSLTAMYLIIGLISSLYFFYNIKRKKSVLIIQIFLLFAIFLTQRRLTSGLALIVFFFEYVMCFKPSWKLCLLAIITLFILIFGLENIPGVSGLLGKWGQYISAGNVLSNRGNLWNSALSSFFTSPIYGHGWGALSDRLQGGTAHNSYFQILADTGLLGFFLIYVYHFYFLIKSIFLFIKKHHQFWLINICMVFFLFWFCSCLFEAYMLDPESMLILLFFERFFLFITNECTKSEKYSKKNVQHNCNEVQH